MERMKPCISAGSLSARTPRRSHPLRNYWNDIKKWTEFILRCMLWSDGEPSTLKAYGHRVILRGEERDTSQV